MAKLIITAGIKKLKENYIKTGHNNQAARALYKKLGFKEIAREYSWVKYF